MSHSFWKTPWKLVRKWVKRQITPYYYEYNFDPVDSWEVSLRTTALDNCSRSLRQGCSQAWGWDSVPVQPILEWCVLYMHAPGLRIWGSHTESSLGDSPSFRKQPNWLCNLGQIITLFGPVFLLKMGLSQWFLDIFHHEKPFCCYFTASTWQ